MQLLLYTVQVVTEWSDGFKGMDKKKERKDQAIDPLTMSLTDIPLCRLSHSHAVLSREVCKKCMQRKHNLTRLRLMFRLQENPFCF